MNSILNARVSTDKQPQKELSIPAQAAVLRQLAKNKDWQVIAEDPPPALLRRLEIVQ